MKPTKQALVIVVLVIGLFIFPVNAIVPDKFEISSPNPQWIKANGYDSAVITITASNNTSGPIDGALVAFSGNNTLIKSFSPDESMTIGGKASTTITAGFQSGTTKITAKIFYREDDTNLSEPLKTAENTTEIYIDHDTPYRIPTGGVILPSGGEATVGSTVTVGVQMQDAHGNVVDNRKETWEGTDAEKVKFIVTGSPSDTGYFQPDGLLTITSQVNETGWAVASYRLDIRPGPNILKFEPQTSVPDIKRTIMGIANGIPFTLKSQVFPSEYLPADGLSAFYLLYTVEDEFQNGLQITPVAVNTTLGENYIFYTNATGQIGMKYGPKSEIGDILITATIPTNPSLSVSDLVRFVNLTANQMLFTATPQSMASYDARPSYSTLYGYVLDQEGNPVQGERVKFTIVNEWYDNPGTANVTEHPSLKNSSVELVNSVWETTNAQGYAEVLLKPCSFNTNEFAPPYDPAATGHCTVEADWTNINGTHVVRQLTFTFKNYPYLSAVTEVSKTRVNVTDTVDVTLKLKGDGFMLIPKPVDVMMVVDRSLSMNESDMENGMKRIDALKNAASNFVDEIKISANYTTNRIGLVPYSTNVYTEQYRYPNNVRDLSTDYNAIKTQINALQVDYYTASRLALKTAIERMNAFPNSDPRTIRTIVFMTDGEYNYYGDPLARGYGFNSTYPGNKSYDYTYWKWYDEHTIYADRHTVFDKLGGQTKVWNSNINTNQNMSLFAKNNNLKIYTITFSPDVNQNGTTWLVMENLANVTGGKHFHANSAAQLNDVYTQIAGELKTKAGVNTTTTLDFQNVTVKNATVAGAEAFNYVFEDGKSTYWKKYKTGQESTPYAWGTINDTVNWTTNHALNFNVGTIEVNDNWEVTFRLQVLSDGDIHVFGNNSLITFDDNTKSLHLPDTIITAIPNMVNETFTYSEFTETEVNVTQVSNTVYEWKWNRHYTGDFPLQELYFISLDGGYQWTLVGERTLPPEVAKEEKIGVFTFDIRNILPYGTGLEGLNIDFKLKAFAVDAPSPQSPRGPPIARPGGSNISYITLK